MKRRFFWTLVPLLSAVAALSGCGGEGAPDATASPATAATKPPEVAAAPPVDSRPTAPAGVARQVVERTDTFLFEYSYPQAAGDIPELGKWLDERLDRRRNALSLDAARGRDSALDRGFPFNIYSSETVWEVVTDIPGWLSMSADLSAYTGGAHPNYAFDAMVWDKTRNIALEPVAFFTTPEKLDELLGKQLCDALNAERAKRRGEPVATGSDDLFDECVEVNATNLLLGSRGKQKFDRIGVRIAPYLAGPYAEGSYEFTFPVTAEMLEIVRPEYRDAFLARN